MNRLLSIFLVLLLFNVVFSSPIIATEYGKIEGFSLFLTNGNKANIFLGIPFASPPIDELRFEVKIFTLLQDTPKKGHFWDFCAIFSKFLIFTLKTFIDFSYRKPPGFSMREIDCAHYRTLKTLL